MKAEILAATLFVSLCVCGADPSADVSATTTTDMNQANHSATIKPKLDDRREAQQAFVGNPPSGNAARDAIDSQKLLIVPGVPDGTLKTGMDYAYFRRAILAKGWVPVADTECRANVDNGNEVCEQMPELSDCSADGYCLMHFRLVNTDKIMEVGTYGDTTGWNAQAEVSQLAVTGLIFSTKKSH